MNLGHSYKTVEEAVTAANVRCDVDELSYVTASRIVCRTRQSPTPVTAGYPVVVKLREEHRYTAISNGSFTYVDPVIKGIEPTKGKVLFVNIALSNTLGASDVSSSFDYMIYLCDECEINTYYKEI